MGQVTQVLDVKFTDYFNEYGFGDGDGPEYDVAWDLRKRVVQEINDRFYDRFETGFDAHELDSGSCHNDCMIGFYWGSDDLDITAGEDGQFTYTAYEGVQPLDASDFITIVEILREVEKVFDEMCAGLTG